MAQRFEYDVIQLRTVHDANERRCFRWQSKRGGCHDVSYDRLEELLNERGREGWHCVSHDTDQAYGSTLIMQRALPENAAAPEPKARRRPQSAPESPIPDAGMLALLEEVRALRTEVARQRIPQPVPHVTVQPTAVHFEEVSEALQPILGALRDLKRESPHAFLSAEAVERLGVTLERSIVQAIAAALEPRLMPALPESDPVTTPWYRRSLQWAFGR